MRQAILTRYLPPTNCRGAKVRAIAGAGALSFAWNHELDCDMNHKHAAFRYAQKKEWLVNGIKLFGGMLPNEDYAFVFVVDGERENAVYEKHVLPEDCL